MLILKIRKQLSRIDNLDSSTTIKKIMINYNLVNKVKNLINNHITIKINFIDFIINNNLFLFVRITFRMFISINNNHNKTINTLSNQIFNLINYLYFDNLYKSSSRQTRLIRRRRIVFYKDKIIEDFQKETTKVDNLDNNLNFVLKQSLIRLLLMRILNQSNNSITSIHRKNSSTKRLNLLFIILTKIIKRIRYITQIIYRAITINSLRTSSILRFIVIIIKKRSHRKSNCINIYKSITSINSKSCKSIITKKFKHPQKK